MRVPCFWARYTLLHPHLAKALLTWDHTNNKYLMSTYYVPCSVLGGTGKYNSELEGHGHYI